MKSYHVTTSGDIVLGKPRRTLTVEEKLAVTDKRQQTRSKNRLARYDELEAQIKRDTIETFEMNVDAQSKEIWEMLVSHIATMSSSQQLDHWEAIKDLAELKAEEANNNYIE